MTNWIPNLEGRTGPRYLRITDAIGGSIRDGSLREGERLPPQRDLAYRLGVSLNTVSRAYAEARRRGFVTGEVGRGTFVRSAGPLPLTEPRTEARRPDDGPIDFSLNLPFVGASAATLTGALDALRASPGIGACLDFQAGSDLERHTEAGAAWIARAGLDASGDDVVLTSGAQHGLLAALMAATRPGDALLGEGQYPLWNPYLFAGMPSFGSLAYIKYIYPPTPVFNFMQNQLWFPPLTWMLGHLLLGGLGMVWLLSRWKLSLGFLLLGAVG